jgi:hypothetical protein
MYKITTNDSFTVTRKARQGYNIWVLTEFSLPDNDGIYMRANLIAQFGNTKNKESFVYARACANALCDAWNK